MNQCVAVVLAAGKGTRMKSALPKVLVPVAGRPMIDYVLDALDAAGIRDVVVVVGYEAGQVKEALRTRANLAFAEQSQQLGTGHAVMVCREVLAAKNKPVLIVTGDSPLMQSSSIAALLEAFEKDRSAALLGTTCKENPAGLGRIVRDSRGDFVGIVEEKDATPAQRTITEVNMSCYLFDCRELLHALDQLSNRNAQGEYYLTDCPGILRAEGKDVRALPVLKPIESMSINNLEELAAVEAVMTEASRRKVEVGN